MSEVLFEKEVYAEVDYAGSEHASLKYRDKKTDGVLTVELPNNEKVFKVEEKVFIKIQVVTAKEIKDDE